jgi:hypothetical protein
MLLFMCVWHLLKLKMAECYELNSFQKGIYNILAQLKLKQNKKI